MSDIIKTKLIINKRNGQVNMNPKKKELPPEIQRILKKNNSSKHFIKWRLEGFE